VALVNEGNIVRGLALLLLLLLSGLAQAAEPTITVTVGNDTRSFTRGELLARPDATTIHVARDVAYRRPMTYRAVPVASVLAGMTLPPDTVLEAVALNGFVAQILPDLLLKTDESKAVAWLAIEPAEQPWPAISGKNENAGPFYIVWTGAEVGSIRSEQWPYQLAKLVSRPSPLSRWPALAVNSALPANDPVRAGQALFVIQCLPCHKLNGAGAADVGPDLNQPDRISHAAGAARLDPQPQSGAHLACSEYAGACRLSERQRHRACHCLSETHGWQEAGAVGPNWSGSHRRAERSKTPASKLTAQGSDLSLRFVGQSRVFAARTVRPIYRILCAAADAFDLVGAQFTHVLVHDFSLLC
jgi:mono/diheme cytochrome c family protein